MPSEGWNMNSHSTPATAGATAEGQISSVRYTPLPRTTRSAITASSSAMASPQPATASENRAVVWKEAR